MACHFLGRYFRRPRKNNVADALSCIIYGLFEINISREENDLEQRIRTTSVNDENYTKMMEEL
jgi:hypothetical protein